MSRLKAVVLAAVLASTVAVTDGVAAGAARTIDAACPTTLLPSRFFDVLDANPHRRAIDCAVHWEVAQGTAESRYAPGGGVTRGQMATFVFRLITKSGGALPANAPDAFDDDRGHAHEASINALAEAGVVGGKGGRRYDPNAPVTRDQMATFLVRAFERRTGTTLPAGPDAFDDDAANAHQANIDRAAAAGFASGTAVRRYSPAGVVRREQMASFLTRVLDKLVAERRATVPFMPWLDPACFEDEIHATLCEFVMSMQFEDHSTLSAAEREVAKDAQHLPKGPWRIAQCGLYGDITILCEIEFTAAPSPMEMAAGFWLGPANAEYDGDGGLIVAPGEEIRAFVGGYAGVGVLGDFHYETY